MKEILFKDITSIVLEKDRVSTELNSDKWHAIDYEINDFSGKMIYAKAGMDVKPITLDFGVTGEWDVYLGSMNMGGDNSTTISLNGEKHLVRSFGWMSYLSTEWIEENYFKTIDFSKNKFVLSARTDLGRNASLCYVRLVKREEKDVEKERNTIYHFDTDYFAEEEYKSVDEMISRIDLLKDASAEALVHESVGFIYGDVIKGRETIKGLPNHHEDVTVKNYENKEYITHRIIEKIRSIGAKAYVGLRHQVGRFVFPHLSAARRSYNAFEECNKNFAVKTRLGKDCGMLSFAYPEVRKFAIDNIINEIQLGWDGISLFFHRGTFVGFEKPVMDKVMALYGVEANRLPRSDERLTSVMCGFVTDFMRELKTEIEKTFDRKIDINVNTLYGVKDSFEFGFDVKTWAKEGLVDSISQGLMAFSENLEGCVGNDGLIDLNKYEEYLSKWFTVWRDIPYSEERVLEGSIDYIEAISGTSVKFYPTLGWERDEPSVVLPTVEKLRRLGLNKFYSWNTNHKAKHLHIFNMEKFAINGSNEEYDAKGVKYKRVLSLAGTDISENSPNWRG